MGKALSTRVASLYYAIQIGIAKGITLNEWWFSNEKNWNPNIFFENAYKYFDLCELIN